MSLAITEQELKKLIVAQLELMNEDAFDKCCLAAKRLHVPIERVVTERGRIPFRFLLEQLAREWSVGYTDLQISDVDANALACVPEKYARAHLLIPFGRDGRRGVRLAMWNPRDQQVIEEIEKMTHMKVQPYVAPARAIRRAHLLYNGDLRQLLLRAAERAVEMSKNGADGKNGVDGHETSVSELFQRIVEYAAVSRASDIHIEPYQFDVLVRFRIDGVLHEVLTVPADLLPGIASRIKVLAGMRIDEKRVPQDGRAEADLGGLQLDLRVSSIPGHWGEKVVIRVLSKEGFLIDLEDLGLGTDEYQQLRRNLLRPYGMVLITGPTGSGKSTTLYSALTLLGSERQNVINISTVEDPVEYTLPRVNQIPVNPAAGVVFSTALRALLRQDPDVIMVGEVRDRETAEIAIRAAMVGRLLLSTLHTNDATSAVPRLIDMGVEPFLLASTLTLVVAQRLARRICKSCVESVAPDPTLIDLLRARPDFASTIARLEQEGVLSGGADALLQHRLFRGRGCLQCNFTGYYGRVGIFELFEVDDELRRMIMQRQDASALRSCAVQKGMKTLFQDGLAKSLLGETTLDEVFRIAL